MAERINEAESSAWNVPSSIAAKGSVNAIRQCEEKHFVEALEQRNMQLDLIKLSIGEYSSLRLIPVRGGMHDFTLVTKECIPAR